MPASLGGEVEVTRLRQAPVSDAPLGLFEIKRLTSGVSIGSHAFNAVSLAEL